ncbi:MAG: ATPase domain-containing protein [archaeon]
MAAGEGKDSEGGTAEKAAASEPVIREKHVPVPVIQLMENYNKVERAESGIPGFDDLVAGGIPRGSFVLLSGMCGTGKTTFSMQFLYDGAKRGEPGVFISLEEQPETLIRNAGLFGLDFYELIRKKVFAVKFFELYDFDKFRTNLEEIVDEMKAKRVVIESSSILGLFFEDKYKFRKALLELAKIMRERNITTILISEVAEGSEALSTFGVEEFAADGVICMNYVKAGNVFMRALNIRKMRDTIHSMKIHPLQMTGHGVYIYPTEEIF